MTAADYASMSDTDLLRASIHDLREAAADLPEDWSNVSDAVSA